MGALSANSNIAITIFNVRNPEVTTATSTFEIYHMDGNTALAINRAVTGVGITVLPTNIIIKSSNISSHV